LGAILLAVALWQKRTVWRIVLLIMLLLFAGAEWTFLFAMKLPAYDGPVAEGKAFPKFTTERADGTPFTERDLQDGRNHVLVFFRGRW